MNQDLIISFIDEQPEILRARFIEYGYLYFKRYADSNACQTLLTELIQVSEPYISFDAEAKHPLLNGEPFFETDAIWDEIYPKMQALASFHHFFHTPAINRLMRTVVNADPFVYPMKMARIATPKKAGYETPAHQDAHSHQAGPSMAGIWLALHDITEEMGRLKVLPYSHKNGVRKVIDAQGVGGVQCEIFPHERNWHVNDYEQGDVIIFHSCCVHKSEPNTAQKASRMSIDTRFCDYGAPVFISNIEPHHAWRIEELSWKNIYQNWPDKKLQYYWQDYPAFVDTLLSDRPELYQDYPLA